MPQATHVIPDSDGLTFLQNLNTALEAIQSGHKGNTAPSYKIAGTPWIDDSSTPWRFKRWDGSNWVVEGTIDPVTGNWVPWKNGAAIPDAADWQVKLLAKTGGYTVQTADKGKLITCDASSVGYTVTLPSLAEAGDGFVVGIKKIDSSTNVVTIDGNGSELVDGQTSKILTAENESVILVRSGAGWRIMAHHREAGTAVGNMVALEDVGGAPGLPAVDGSQLTNVNGFKTGDMVFSFRKSPEPGRLFVNGSTIGPSGSGANYTGTTYKALFEFFWSNLSNSYAPVSGGRGSSGPADWTAGKRITMPNMRRRVPVMADNTAPARVLGETGGSEDAVVVEHNHGSGSLTASSGGDHTHPMKTARYSEEGSGATGFQYLHNSGGNKSAATVNAGSGSTHNHSISGTTGNAGEDGSGKNVPPFIVGNWEVQV